MPTLPTIRQRKTARSRTRSRKKTRPAEQSLARAFASFTSAAGTLEKSYGVLQSEVARLRRELEQTNRDLANSLEDNERMRSFLKRILKGLPCGVLVFDSRNSLRMANPEARRLLSLEPNLTFQAQQKLPESVQRLVKDMAEAGSATEMEWLPDMPSDAASEGSSGVRAIAVTRAPLPESDFSAGETIFILRDITEEKQRDAERESARNLKSLAEMSTLLAHEIRNPLGSMELFAGLLSDATEEAPELRKWVDYLQAGLRTVSATVNNVLQFHNQPTPELLPVDMARLLRETVEFLKPLARQRSVTISLSNRAGRVQCPADPHRLQQVFFNLSLNAFRAMSVGGTLTIAAAWPEDGSGRLQIVFADTGTGIAARDMDSIFETGFTTTPGSPGLGLAVCKKVVEQHQGTIRAESRLGKGTTFTLTLPITGAAV